MAEYIPGLGMYRVGPGEVGYGPGVRMTTGLGMTAQTVDYSIARPVPLPGVAPPPISAPRTEAFTPPTPAYMPAGRFLDMPPAPAMEIPLAPPEPAPLPAAVPVMAPSLGPPWTQLDMVVEPRGSENAAEAIALGDIRGWSIVRGVFDGRFRGFISYV